MLSKPEAIIYLANQRGCSGAEWFRSYYTFNFGEFRRESRTPFGSLLAFNEHTLKEGRIFSFVHTEAVKVLLIPVAGELNYRSGDVEGTVDVGQVSYSVLPAGVPLELSNRYASNSINFLHVCVRADNTIHDNYPRTFTSNFDNNSTELAALNVSSDELFFIGKLSGREDVVLQRKLQCSSGIFIYQISGTCEVNGRLLLPGDALSLMRVETIEFEALTHEAIVFVAEIPFPDGN